MPRWHHCPSWVKGKVPVVHLDWNWHGESLQRNIPPANNKTRRLLTVNVILSVFNLRFTNEEAHCLFESRFLHEALSLSLSMLVKSGSKRGENISLPLAFCTLWNNPLTVLADFEVWNERIYWRHYSSFSDRFIEWEMEDNKCTFLEGIMLRTARHLEYRKLEKYESLNGLKRVYILDFLFQKK